jgi:hypothetical protein
MPNLQDIRADAQRIHKLDATTDLTLTDLNGNSVTVKGKAPEHHTSLDAVEQIVVSSLNSHVEVHEYDLIEAGYTTRNQKNRSSLLNNLVEYADLNGVTQKYKIIDVQPDHMIGIIVCTIAFESE